MLAFLVSLVPIALKALAGSFGSAVGQRMGDAFSSSFEAAGEPQLVQRLATNPTPADEQKAQPVIVASLSENPQLMQTVETTLEEAKPGTIAKAKETADVLARHEPTLVEKIASGEVHYSEAQKALAKQFNWTDEQIVYDATDKCPIGGEDLSFLVGVKYRDARGEEATMLSSGLVLQALPITARCENGHEWRVDKPQP
jgi:hypothetical protein